MGLILSYGPLMFYGFLGTLIEPEHAVSTPMSATPYSLPATTARPQGGCR